MSVSFAFLLLLIAAAAVNVVDAGKLDPFLDFADTKLDKFLRQLCRITEPESFVTACTRATALYENVEENGGKFSLLPRHLQVNYKAVSFISAIGIEIRTPFPEQARDLFFKGFQFHRALGKGNALRLLGYDEEVVEEQYRRFYRTAETIDDEEPPAGSALLTYCGYIGAEYEQLKDFARANYNATDLPVLAPIFNSDATMAGGCVEPNLGFSVRTDWNHHRTEVLAALMTSCPRPYVLHTVWHWESLFVSVLVPDSNEEYFRQLDVSFEFLVDLHDPDTDAC